MKLGPDANPEFGSATKPERLGCSDVDHFDRFERCKVLILGQDSDVMAHGVAAIHVSWRLGFRPARSCWSAKRA